MLLMDNRTKKRWILPKGLKSVSIPQQRRKILHHKSRTGCVTCKSRRIKCDETKPDCTQCVASGRQCGGYNPPKAWIFVPVSKSDQDISNSGSNMAAKTTSSGDSTTQKHSAPPDSNNAETQKLQAARQQLHVNIPRLLSENNDLTETERRKFAIYLRYSPSFTEVAHDSDLELSTKLLPQASHQNRALRAAILSFGSFLESLLDPVRRDEHCADAEYQYHKTIKLLIQAVSETSVSSRIELLMICLLLRYIEPLRNEEERVSIHLNGAFQIMRHFTADPSSAGPHFYHAINRLIARSIIKHSSPSIRLIQKPDLRPILEADSLFTSFGDVLQRACRFLRQSNADRFCDATRDDFDDSCLRLFDNWFLDQDHRSKSANGERGTVYSQIQYFLCRLVLLNLAKPEATRYDQSRDQFEGILKLCNQFHRANTRSVGISVYGDNGNFRFGFAIELTLGVFFVATECRDPIIRRSAISFLRQTFRHELSWHSFHAATIAEWIMRKEETVPYVQPLAERHLKLLSIKLYLDDDDKRTSFRSPPWILVEYAQFGIRSEQWLYLQNEISDEQQLTPEVKAKGPASARLCSARDGMFLPMAPKSLVMAFEKYPPPS